MLYWAFLLSAISSTRADMNWHIKDHDTPTCLVRPLVSILATLKGGGCDTDHPTMPHTSSSEICHNKALL
jgi:hypothetical protein